MCLTKVNVSKLGYLSTTVNSTIADGDTTSSPQTFRTVSTTWGEFGRTSSFVPNDEELNEKSSGKYEDLLISGSGDKSIIIWDMISYRMLSTLVGHTDIICSLSLSQNDIHLVSGSGDKSVKIYKAEKLIEAVPESPSH